ncbi:MAG: hypothetical protein L0Z50_30140 [Verrucomicrobiales bacterium]|nr:hypothetical protein [Verrucomicrobiales bacterium]
MKQTQQNSRPAHARALAGRPSSHWIRSGFLLATAVAFSSVNAVAQEFDSTELKTGISNSLAVIMLFGFVLGIAAVIAGGFAIRRGDVDTGKLSIIGGAVIAAAPAIAFAFFKIFGLDTNATVGIGAF